MTTTIASTKNDDHRSTFTFLSATLVLVGLAAARGLGINLIDIQHTVDSTDTLFKAHMQYHYVLIVIGVLIGLAASWGLIGSKTSQGRHQAFYFLALASVFAGGIMNDHAMMAMTILGTVFYIGYAMQYNRLWVLGTIAIGTSFWEAQYIWPTDWLIGVTAMCIGLAVLFGAQLLNKRTSTVVAAIIGFVVVLALYAPVHAMMGDNAVLPKVPSCPSYHIRIKVPMPPIVNQQIGLLDTVPIIQNGVPILNYDVVSMLDVATLVKNDPGANHTTKVEDGVTHEVSQINRSYPIKGYLEFYLQLHQNKARMEQWYFIINVRNPNSIKSSERIEINIQNDGEIRSVAVGDTTLDLKGSPIELDVAGRIAITVFDEVNSQRRKLAGQLVEDMKGKK